MQSISLQTFRGKNFKFHINRGLSAFSVRDLLEYPDDYQFDFDVFLPSIGMNLQRPLVWTLHQKQQLIISLLKGIKIPIMTLIEVSDGVSIDRQRTYQVIDGKQRLNAILSFCKGEFPIVADGTEYFFDTLPDDCRREINGYWITCDMGYEYQDDPIPDSEKIRWFGLINFAGTAQDGEHMEALRGATVNS